MKPIDLEVRTRTAPWPLRVLNVGAKIALPLIILAGALYGFQVLRDSRPDVPQRPARERVWTVETQTVSFSRHQPVMRLYGEIQSGRDVSLRALVSGEIVEIAPNLRIGALVEAGTALVRIDPFDYEGQLIEARANLLEAEARSREIEASSAAERDALANARDQLALAETDLERARELVGRGTISERTVDDRRLILSQREQGVQQRDNNIAMQQARGDQQIAAIARLERQVVEAERALQNTTLKAPFAGYISEVDADVGRMIGSNDTVVTLIDRSEIEVAVTLSDRQYGRVVEADRTLIDRPVTINWYVGETPLSYNGRIVRIAPQITAASGGVRVFAAVETPDDRDVIRPGAFVEVLVPDRAYDGVVELPETALYPGDQVFVVENERLMPRIVDVIGFAGASVLVRGDLADGETVITTKIATAGEGLKVRDINAPPTNPGGATRQ